MSEKTRLILDTLFHTISGKTNQQSNELAQDIFGVLLEYLKSDKCIYSKKKDQDSLISILTRAADQTSARKSMDVIYACNYACALILTKERE